MRYCIIAKCPQNKGLASPPRWICSMSSFSKLYQEGQSNVCFNQLLGIPLTQLGFVLDFLIKGVHGFPFNWRFLKHLFPSWDKLVTCGITCSDRCIVKFTTLAHSPSNVYAKVLETSSLYPLNFEKKLIYPFSCKIFMVSTWNLDISNW